jgi:hypothetical protein
VPNGVLGGYCVAWEKFRVPGGYYQEDERCSCVIDLVYETKRVTPS